MMRQTLWALVVAPVIAAGPLQDKPDFSGKWVLEDLSQAGPDVARALTVRQSLARTTARGTPMEPVFKDLAVDREFETGVRSESHQIGVIGGVIGGLGNSSGSTGLEGARVQSRFSVKWDGDQLVIQTGTYSGLPPDTGPYRERSEVWSLDADGRLVLTVTDRSSEARPVTRTLRYRRRQ